MYILAGQALPGHAQVGSTSAAKSATTSSVKSDSPLTGPAAKSPIPIELPSFKPTEIAAIKTIGPWIASAGLDLINPDVPPYSAIAKYELSSSTPDAWLVQAVDKKQQQKAVARFFVEGSLLKFQWNPQTTRADAGGLRNCVVRITPSGGAAPTAYALRGAFVGPPLVLDLKNELQRCAFGEDLPGDEGLKLHIDDWNVESSEASISEKSVPLRHASFLTLKSATPDVPGVRLRSVIWKVSGKSPEVILRPELLPVASRENLAAAKAADNKPKTRGVLVNPENLDPTSALTDQLAPAFTIAAMANSKAQIQNQLTMTQNRITTLNNMIAQKEATLDKYSVVIGTPQEIALIQQLRNRLINEISLHRSEVRNLTAMIPVIEKQLAAFPPLEAFGNSLHAKASMQFRVVYQAGPYEVTLLHIGGE